MHAIMIGFWIWDRTRGRTRLKFEAWLHALDAEDRRMRDEAPAGWESPSKARLCHEGNKLFAAEKHNEAAMI